MMNLNPIIWVTALLCSAVITIKSNEQQPFVLKGVIKGQTKGILRMSYASADGKYLQDSALVSDGKFEFKGQVAEPTMVFFSGDVKSRAMDDPNATSFFIEPGKLSAEVTVGDFKNLKLVGSKTQDEMVSLSLKKESLTKALQPISEAYKQANEKYMLAVKEKKPATELTLLKEQAAAVRDKFEPFTAKMGEIDLEFIKTHPNSYVSAYLLRFKVSSLSVDKAEALYAKLAEPIKQSSFGKEVFKEVKSLRSGSPGAVASVFTTQDINGNLLSLSEFKGKKYVLLDFWASWCVPCRKGNPHLLSLYSKYKDKGLEIVGVSDDDSNLPAWKNAVEQDKIGVWKHVLRGLKRTATGYDKSADISEPFGIHTLPTKILIDKNGIIVGRYGGGGENDEAMDKKLAAIFN